MVTLILMMITILILTLESAQTGDFGNYSCLAMNSLGRSRAHTSITGRPAAPVFTRCLQPDIIINLNNIS